MAKRAPKPKPPLDLANRIALTISEAAQSLGVSERHLRTYRSELPVARIGEKPLIPVDALRKWLASRIETEAESTKAAADSILQKMKDGND